MHIMSTVEVLVTFNPDARALQTLQSSYPWLQVDNNHTFSSETATSQSFRPYDPNSPARILESPSGWAYY